MRSSKTLANEQKIESVWDRKKSGQPCKLLQVRKRQYLAWVVGITLGFVNGPWPLWEKFHEQQWNNVYMHKHVVLVTSDIDS